MIPPSHSDNRSDLDRILQRYANIAISAIAQPGMIKSMAIIAATCSSMKLRGGSLTSTMCFRNRALIQSDCISKSLGSGMPFIASFIASTSIRAPGIVVTNGMLSSTASLRIMFPSSTAPPVDRGVLITR